VRSGRSQTHGNTRCRVQKTANANGMGGHILC